MEPNPCPKCGKDINLVGKAHNCVARPIRNVPVAKSANAADLKSAPSQVAGSIPARDTNSRVAQIVEPTAHNGQGVGASPTTATKQALGPTVTTSDFDSENIGSIPVAPTKDKDRVKKWRKANPEKHKAYQRTYMRQYRAKKKEDK